MDAALRQLVWTRAEDRCEYCRLPQEFDELTLQIEHIIPRKHRGPTTEENLALACFACNNHKGTNLTGLDPDSDEITRLYHPRKDRWGDHFEWDGPLLIGLTAIGRTTVDVLSINLDYRVALRASLIEEGVFP